MDDSLVHASLSLSDSYCPSSKSNSKYSIETCAKQQFSSNLFHQGIADFQLPSHSNQPSALNLSLQKLSLGQQLSELNYNSRKSKLSRFPQDNSSFDIYNPGDHPSLDTSEMPPDASSASDYNCSAQPDFLSATPHPQGSTKQMPDPKQGTLPHHMHVNGAMMSETATQEQSASRGTSSLGHSLQNQSGGPVMAAGVASELERRSSSFSSMFPGNQFFPNHHPFDFSSYPMTSPPIYDSTMAIPYNDGHPRRRRISISNGQIGQIINHEAFFYDEHGNQVEEYRGPSGQPHHHNEIRPAQPQYHDQSQSQLLGMHPPPSHPHFITDLNPHLPDRHSHSNVPTMATARGAGIYVPNQVGQAEAFVATDREPLYKREPISPISAPNTAKLLVKTEPSDHLFAAGVPPPNHLLLYNNEVIYNPNDGPIPGTAAWKKQRLLERNRIAALKCRQRKKQVQIQMQQNVSMFEQEVEEKERLLQKYEKLFSLYNSRLRQYFANGNVDSLLLELKELVFLESIDQYDVEADM